MTLAPGPRLAINSQAGPLPVSFLPGPSRQEASRPETEPGMREGFPEEGAAAGPQGSGEGRVTPVCPSEEWALPLPAISRPVGGPPYRPPGRSAQAPRDGTPLPPTSCLLLGRSPGAPSAAHCPQALKSCSCSRKEMLSNFLIDLMREASVLSFHLLRHSFVGTRPDWGFSPKPWCEGSAFYPTEPPGWGRGCFPLICAQRADPDSQAGELGTPSAPQRPYPALWGRGTLGTGGRRPL